MNTKNIGPEGAKDDFQKQSSSDPLVYKEYASVGDAAKILGVSIDTVRRWDKKGLLQSERLDGKNRFFAVDDLEAFKATQKLSTTEVAKQLGLSASTVRRLESQGVLIPQRDAQGLRMYSPEDVKAYQESLNQNPSASTGELEAGLEIAAEQAEFYSYSEPDVVMADSVGAAPSISAPALRPVKKHPKNDGTGVTQRTWERMHTMPVWQKALFWTALAAITALFMFIILFLLAPSKIGALLGYTTVTDKNGTHLVAPKHPGIFAKALSPLTDTAFNAATSINPSLTTPGTGLSMGDQFFALTKDGDIQPNYGITLPNSGYLHVPDQGLIVNLNSEYVDGYKPGSGTGNLAVLPINGNSIQPKSITGSQIADGTIQLTNLSSAAISSLRSSSGSGGGTYTSGAQGPAGPQGATGPTGPAGPQGIQGPAGADGAGSAQTIVAGQGLNGGGSGSTVTLNVNSGNSTHILNNAIEVQVATTSTTSTTSSPSGLEVTSQGLRLVGGCTINQILIWNGSGWACGAQTGGSGGGSLTVQASDGSATVNNVGNLSFGPTSGSASQFSITNTGAGGVRVQLGTNVLQTTNYATTLDPVYVNTGEAPAAGDISGSFGAGLTIAAGAVQLATDTTGSFVSTVLASNGITATGSGSNNAAVSLALNLATTGVTGTSSSVSGLEVDSNGAVRLLGGCSNGQTVKFNGTAWVCSADNDTTLDIKQNSSTVTAGATSINYSTDFSVTSSVTQANVGIDYVNSGITRRSGTESIVGAWAFNDTSFALQDNADSTKRVNYELGGISSGITRTLTVPDVNGTLITTGNLSNITSVGTVTSGTWQGTTVGVQYGGTGTTTFASNGIIYGNGTGALQASAAGTSGQLLVANGAGVPGFVSVSGDATLAASGALTLGTTGVGVGTYGDATHVGQFTVDSKGRVTAASSLMITGAAPIGAAGGDLSGSYPNPTIGKLQNSTLTITTPISGNFISYNGSAFVNQSFSGDLTVNGLGVATIATNSITTTKIADGNVTNAKLANSSLSITAGTGLAGGGSVSLGGSSNGLSVVYGSTASSSVRGDTSLVCASGTGNLTGGGNTITLGTGGTCSAINIINNPTFSGLITGSAGTTGLALTGVPTNAGNSSIVQIGSAIASGNTAINGGTYIGLNSPLSGAGSAADFLNFQNNGVSKLKISNTGLIDTTGGLSVSGTQVLTSGRVLQNVTFDTGLITSGTIGVPRGGTGANTFTSNGLVYGNGVGALQATAAGTSGQVLVANALGVPTFVGLSGDATLAASGALTIGTNAINTSKITDGNVTNAKLANSALTVTAGTGLSGGGSVSLGGSTSLSVSYGSTLNTAAQGNTSLSFTGAGNLTGTVSGTAGGGFTTNTLGLVNNPSFSASVASPLFTNAGVTLSSTGAANDLTLSSGRNIVLSGFNCAAYANGGVLTTDASGNVVCQNDDGGAAGSITGTGTSNRLSFFSATSTLADSWLLQNTNTLQLDTGKNLELISGGLIVNGTTVLTSGRALQNVTGLSVASGGASVTGGLTLGGFGAGVLHTDASGVVGTAAVTNSELQNNSVTVTAGSNLSGGGAVALGSSVTLNVSSAPTFSGLVTSNGLSNTGSTVFSAVSLGNFPTGGSIGSAATTVDVTTAIAIAQTTSGQTLNLPLPSVTSGGRIMFVTNVGTASFVMSGQTINASSAATFEWTGSAWIPTTSVIAGSGLTQSGNVINSAAVTSVSNDTNIQGSISGNVLSLSFSGRLSATRGGTGVDGSTASNGSLLIGNGSGYTLGTLANNGGLTVTNGAGTIGLAVNYGATSTTAVRGDTTLTCPSGSGNLTGGGGTITLGSGGSCGSLSISNAPTFTTSVSSPLFTGTAGVTLSSGGTSDLGLTSASGNLVLAATLVKTTGSLGFDLNSGSNNVFSVNNSGAGTADLNIVDGGLQIAGSTVLTSGKALQNLTGLSVTSGGANIAGGLTSAGTTTLSALNSAGVVHTNASGVLSTGAVVLGTDTSGAYVSSVGAGIGTTVGGTAGVPTVSVVYGSAGSTAVQGNVTVTCPSGTGNLTGGGGIITLGTGGSCGAITTNAAVSFGTSVTSPLITNTGALTLSTTGANDLTLSSGSNQIAVVANTLKTTNSLTVDLNAASPTTFTISNSNASNVANLSVEGSVTSVGVNAGTGAIQGTGGLSITGNSTITGTLSSLTGLNSSGTIIFSGLSSTGVVHNSAAGVLSTGLVVLGTDTSGAYVASVGAGTGTTIGGTASAPTVAVNYGATSTTAVRGDTTLVCPSGTGNLSGAGNTINLGSGGTCNGLTIINNPSFSGLITGSASTTGLALTGTPTPGTGVTSLIQVGAAIASGNSTAGTGGTYIGLNAPVSGAGSTADFVNFQNNGASKFKVDATGVLDTAGGHSIAGTVVLTSGRALQNLTGLTVSSGGANITGGLTSAGTTTLSALNSAGVVHNSAAGVLSTSLVALGTDTSGAYVASVGAGTGTSIGGTATNPTVAVSYGATSTTAVRGDTALVCPSGTGNLSGGGNTITLGSGGTCGALSTNAAVSFGTSVTAPLITNAGTLNLQTTGANDLTLTSGSNQIALSANTLKSTNSLTVDLNAASPTTFTVTNSNASNVANLSVEGAITVGTGLTVTTGGIAVTGNSTIAGTLSSLTGITSSGTITFSGLTNGVAHIAGGVLSGGLAVLGTDTSGAYVASVGAGTGTTIGGTATNPTVAVSYGATSTTAVRGDTTLVCPSGTGNLSGAGNTITLGSGGTCNSLTVVNNPNFSGLLTASANTTALSLSGTPSNAGNNSLVQIGSAIASGNSVANGGTYLGLNTPAAGAGSAADFLNFQANGVYKLKVSNAGLIDTAGGLALNGTTLITSGGVLQNLTTDASIITAGTLAATRGGTGFGTYAVGDLLYASSTSALSRLSAGLNGQCLQLAAGVPVWSGCASGSLFSIAGSTGGAQTVSGGNTFSILAGASGNLTSVSAAGPQITIDISSSPSFTTSVTTPSLLSISALAISSGGTGAASLSSAGSTSVGTAGVTIKSGDATVGSNLSAGTVRIDTGSKTGIGTGVVNIGDTNATSINIGNGSSTTGIALTAATLSLNSATLQRAAAGTTTFDLLNAGADTTFSLNNSDATRVANLNLADGALQSGGTTVLTSARVLQNVTTDAAIVTSGSFGVARGGTGLTSYTTGDILFANSSTTLSTLADAATGNVIISGGAGVAPTYGKVVLGTHTSGAYVASVGAGTGTAIGGTATNPTVAVNYGSSSTTAARGDTSLSFTGSGNLTGSLSGTAGGGFTTTTLAVSSTPSFTSITASGSTNALALTGAPAAGTGATSLFQLGNVISGGNTAVNGGTYIGINTPATGNPGFAADFLNFQVNSSIKLKVDNSGNLTAGTINGATVTSTSFNSATISGGTLSGGSVSGGSLSASAVNGLSVSAGTISSATFTGTLTGSSSPTITGFGTINGASLSGGTLSGGSVSGGALTATTVNGLNVSGAALSVVATATNLTIDAGTTGKVQIGATSIGDIELGGGSASTGCTVTNSTGALACSSTVNGATISGGTLSGGSVSGGTLTSTAVNSLLVSGTAITGTSALTIASGGTAQNITLDGTTTGQVSIGGTSTGDILLGGGSASTGCTVTNASGNLTCTGTINGATISGGTLSGGSVSGGTLTSGAVNNLLVSGTAITGTAGLTIDANTSNTVTIGGTSTGNIIFGAGSGGAGCTITRSNGNLACGGSITGVGVSAGSGALTGNSLSINSLAAISNSGAITGVTTLALSGAITGATSGNTINGLIISSGVLSGVAGITTSGGYTQSGTSANTFTGATTIQTTTNSTAALNVSNSNGSSLFNIDSTANNSNNLLANPSIESAISGNWALKGSATVAQDSSQKLFGNNSLAINATGANGGAQQTYALASTTTYSFAVYARLNSTNMSTFEIGYSNDGISDTSCLTGQTVLRNGWTRFSCAFTTSTVSGTPYVYVKQTDGTTRTIYIDGATLELVANTTTNYHEGSISLQSNIASPLVIQNASNTTGALQVLSSKGANVFSVDTTDSNLLAGSAGFETNASGYTYNGAGGTVLRDSSMAYTGSYSMKVITAANANNGLRFTFANATPAIPLPAISTTYTLSWYDQLASGTFTDIIAAYARDGVTEVNCTGITSQAVSIGGWTRHSCQIVTDGTAPAAGAYITIKQTAATAHTFNIDSVQLELGTNPSGYGAGAINFNATIASPVNIRELNNSTTSFQIQNAAATAIFSVDTLNNAVNLAVKEVNTTNTTALSMTGTPASSASSSLVQLGSAIVGGNAVANGGTYLGINLPAGAGSAADFVNFQNSGAARFSISSAGVVTTAGAIAGPTTGNTINGLIINSGALSGVTSLSLTGATDAISLATTNGALTIDANGTGTISIGATSTGDILFGGGSASTGCTITNSTGAFACTAGITAATSGSTINSLIINAGAVSNATTITASGLISGSGFKSGAAAGISIGTCSATTAVTGGTITNGIATGAGACNNTGVSDIRLKKNIVTVDDSILSKIKDVRTINFDYDCTKSYFTDYSNYCNKGTRTGVIAQELALLFPDLVTDEGTADYKQVDYQGLSMYSLKAVSELARYITADGDAHLKSVTASDLTAGIVLSDVVASQYPMVEQVSAGQVVYLDANGMVRAATSPFQKGLLGTVVNVANGQVAVATAGKVSTKVNGTVAVGDLLTSSSVAGVAQVASGSGPIIGMATTSTSSAGTVIMTVQNSQAGGSGSSSQALQDQVNNLSSQVDGIKAGLVGYDGQPVNFNNLKIGALHINLDTIAEGGLTVGGPAEFKGTSLFDQLVTFGAPVDFNEETRFNGNANFNNNTGGYAVINAGRTAVHVVFGKPYAQAPIISLTKGDNTISSYHYQNVTATGFDIVLDQVNAQDVHLSWLALSVISANTFVQQ